MTHVGSTENKVIARRFLEAQARGDIETLDELMAPDFADRSLLPGQKPGREDYKQSVASMLAVFVNTGFTVEAQIAEGDHVVSRYTGSSVHRGKFLGVDPTGRESRYSGIAIHRIAGGKILEEWSEADNLEVVQPALEQELRRRERIEHEKMAALGKLSAGLAHELNNPAAAARRAAAELRGAILDTQLLALEHDARLSSEVRETLVGVLREASDGIGLDPLSQSDREQDLADWLDERGLGEAWDLAPILGGAGLEVGHLERLATGMEAGTLAVALEWLGATLRLTGLAEEVGQSAGRISDLVLAMKEYTYMDRAAYAGTDVREGLETTLTILGHKMKGAVLEREYEEDLPEIWANAGELNQVWTNLIENAIDAVDEGGNIKVRTAREKDQVLVEISDDGPGIPEEVRSRIFDPFFTTKETGEGTGLGLDIVRRIVASHSGEITFHSEPGETRFTVRLPVDQRLVNGG
ncbi:MAG TPA: ATP-binding protein [Rubrobacter sp.]|nr:ATP-binding protein [Rubrobacter sp.]